MTIAVFFEASGIVRDALIGRGYDAVSVDLRETDRPGPHIQGDVFDHLNDGWTGAIMHPECTYMTSSGLHWNGRIEGRSELTKSALNDVRRLMAAPIQAWAIENPRGCIGSQIRPADQMIQPYEFGHSASKETHLWLKGLPLLVRDPAKRIIGRLVRDPKSRKWVERFDNQTDSGQNKLSPSDDRWSLRSETYQGIADAFAEQWGAILAGKVEPYRDLFWEKAS